MFEKLKLIITSLLLLTTMVLPLNANAVFIDFDDIVAPPASPFSCEAPNPCGLILSNEY